MHVPIRVRITAAFGAVMLILVGAISLIARVAMAHALADEIDSGLRFRAESVLAVLPAGPSISADPRFQEPTEAFVQVLARDGTVLSAPPQLRTSVLSAAEVATIRTPTFLRRQVAGVAGTARLLVVPLSRPGRTGVIVVGQSTADRSDALRELTTVLAVGGPVAVALACLAGWVVAARTLRPIDRMRAQASAITASGLDRRLTVPRARDELQRLAGTLNDMLGRLASAMAGERAFLERAGHELRTPLAALRAEIDLALRQGRTAAELTAALQSVSQETDRLARLADDLLVLARAADGRLAVRIEPVNLGQLLQRAADSFAAQAHEQSVAVRVDGPDVDVELDPVRMRQALSNLLANALQWTPAGGSVDVVGVVDEGSVRITVSDTGPGLRDDATETSGLGLKIVRAVAAAHRGTVVLGAGPGGGTRVELTLPRDG